MKVAIQARNFELSEGLRAHIEHRLAFALSPFQDRIYGVVVVLSDINGPKGGIDKRCLLKVRLRGLSELIIDETEANLQIAVNRAADRARRTLDRRFRRLRGTFGEQIR